MTMALVTAALLGAAGRSGAAARLGSTAGSGSGTAGGLGSARGRGGASGLTAGRLAATMTMVVALVPAALRGTSAARLTGRRTTRGLATSAVAMESFRFRRAGEQEQAGDEQSRQHKAGLHDGTPKQKQGDLKYVHARLPSAYDAACAVSQAGRCEQTLRTDFHEGKASL